jgi:hypothetical protein
VVLAVEYAVDWTNNVVDVTTTTAYSDVTDFLEPDYVSGSGVADILPFMGVSSITLPVWAVIDLQTAELLYFQDGNGSGPYGALAHIQAAND